MFNCEGPDISGILSSTHHESLIVLSKQAKPHITVELYKVTMICDGSLYVCQIYCGWPNPACRAVK